jgi:hypothetical protein
LKSVVLNLSPSLPAVGYSGGITCYVCNQDTELFKFCSRQENPPLRETLMDLGCVAARGMLTSDEKACHFSSQNPSGWLRLRRIIARSSGRCRRLWRLARATLIRSRSAIAMLGVCSLFICVQET